MSRRTDPDTAPSCSCKEWRLRAETGDDGGAAAYGADVWEAEARVIVIASTKMCDGVASTEVFLMRFEGSEERN